MDEQQPAEGIRGPVSAATAQPVAAGLAEADRKGRVIVGSMLAGLGLGIAVALLMHVVQQVSPDGSGVNIDGSVLIAVLVAGPVFGLGMAVALAAVIPSASTDSSPSPSGSETPANHAGEV